MTSYNAPLPYNAAIPYDGIDTVPLVLTLTNVSPSHGPYLGGQLLTLVGTQFVAGIQVTVGGQTATSVILISPTLLSVRTPARVGTAGSVDVTVTDPTGATATLAGAYTYDAAILPPPPPPPPPSPSPSAPTTLRRQPYVVGVTRVREPYVAGVLP